MEPIRALSAKRYSQRHGDHDEADRDETPGSAGARDRSAVIGQPSYWNGETKPFLAESSHSYPWSVHRK